MFAAAHSDAAAGARAVLGSQQPRMAMDNQSSKLLTRWKTTEPALGGDGRRFSVSLGRGPGRGNFAAPRPLRLTRFPDAGLKLCGAFAFGRAASPGSLALRSLCAFLRLSRITMHS